MNTLPSPSNGAPTAISAKGAEPAQFNRFSCWQYSNEVVCRYSVTLCDTEINPTSVSILINISNVADCHSKHGVVGPVEADGSSLIIPVSERVQVDVHSSSDLGFAVKEVWSSDNQVSPTEKRFKKLDLFYFFLWIQGIGL